MCNKPKIIVIVGPTASGKSDLAVLLARKFNGEVISADSRQVYRGLDLGTGKVNKKEMGGITHHLLSVSSPKKQYSVAEYQRDANLAIKKILFKKKIPIICGGTGFYVDALIYNAIFPDVPPNIKLRKKLEQKTNTELFQILQKKDPERAGTIDRHNPRRLVRAIEIVNALGSVPARNFNSHYNPLFIGISVPTTTLNERIRTRLLTRIRRGMCAEVRNLHAKGLSWKRMEELGLEYRYIARYLGGKITKNEMLTQLTSEIIHYAKRQHTWFKRNKYICWVSLTENRETEILVQKFIKNTPSH